MKLAEESENVRLDQATLRPGIAALLEGRAPGRYWVAELDGPVVGQLLITYEWSDWRNCMVWWIQSVYVAQEARRTGVLRTLYAHVRGEAQAAGAGGLRLYVDNTNARAQAAYAALGMNGDHYRVFEDMFREPRNWVIGQSGNRGIGSQGSRSAIIGSTRVARTRGNQRRDQASGAQRTGGDRERRQIERADAVEHAANRARDEHRRHETDDDAGRQHRQAVPDDESDRPAAARAERHPQSDLARALADGVRQHAVNAERGQEQRGAGKQRQQRGAHPRQEHGARQDLIHRAQIVDRLLGIHRPDGAANGRGERDRVALGSRHDGHPGRRPLPQRQVHLLLRLAVEPLVPHVTRPRRRRRSSRAG